MEYTMLEPDLYQSVLEYYEGGRCVLPPVAKGAKYPSIIENNELKAVPWKIHTAQRVTPTQLKAWFGNGTHVGVALAGGLASGITLDDGTRTSAEFLDIEYGETVNAFIALAKARGYEALLNRLPWEDPPRGGLHTGWLCIESAGNTKLATRQIGIHPDGTPELETLIETRGEGGLLVVAPTPAGIHPDVPERGYVMVRGSWAEMPVISPEARQALLECARALNEYVDPEPPEDIDRPNHDPPEGSPGEDFNRRATQADVRAILERHGWAVDHSLRGTDFLRRPGKSVGYSATLGHVGPNILYVFSSNATPFRGPHGDQPGTAYKPFGVYGLLEFSGDFQAAARMLALDGYGASRNGHVPVADNDGPPIESEPDPTLSANTDEEIHLTDVGNGLRLVKQFGADIRHIFTWKKWILWKDGRWVMDEGGLIEWHAKQVIAELYAWAQREVGALVAESAADDSDEDAQDEHLKRVKAILKWAHASENGNHIDLMVKRARVNPVVQLRHDQLDVDPMLFPVANGTIDLRTGVYRAPHRQDFITKQSPVLYDPDAGCPRWLAFLQRIMGHPQQHDTLSPEVRDQQIKRADRMITYIKRLTGMSLTADITAQQLQFLYGPGQNGKSTFLNTILALMGDYGMQAAPNFLLVREHEQHPTELTDLFGKRFVSTIEIEKGKELAEALMKTLTGSEHVRARRMREDFWEFAPTWKVWLAANDKPKVKGRDKATWRRIKLIPFEVIIPDEEVDPNLPQTLLQELPGILNWAIEGCHEWQEKGLDEPQEVTDATAAYREETDILGQFIHECGVTQKDIKTQSSVLHKAFEDYAGQSLSPVAFADLMKASGYKKTTIRGKVYWLGIGLPQLTLDTKQRAAGNKNGE
jgi:putative DNA primase/helicase